MIVRETEEPLIAQGIERSILDSVNLSNLGGIDDFIFGPDEALIQSFPRSRIYSDKIESLIAEAVELLI